MGQMLRNFNILKLKQSFWMRALKKLVKLVIKKMKKSVFEVYKEASINPEWTKICTKSVKNII